MFLNELTPVLKELTQQPIAFLGGFVSGLLRLNLYDDPVKSWLDQQTGSTSYTPPTEENNGNSSGPQSINID
ncbi:hypothetical protein PN499_10180 [Kamptonema animale CS-326]|uniref:hypothetical protein n=1 Tax=Kamptonema TaxID=1501433 RepID=UPI0001DACCD5|nr:MULTISPECIES: hypothetical protein [Kamptonema]MDB9511548.1 hypothetical protein [Kamptonema animale CS-326]CBN58682.1 conserved hypothetical protein [Kamptonema sp. PCC 6506]